MSDTIHPGDESAFPTGTSEFAQIGDTSEAVANIKGGLTKRELFAAMALQSIIAKTPVGHPEMSQDAQDYIRQVNAAGAVAYADMLLRELAK